MCRSGQHIVQPFVQSAVVVEAEHGGLGQALGQFGAVALGQAAQPRTTLAPESAAASRVSTESFLADSTKPQVFTSTTSTSVLSALSGTCSQPLPVSRPANSLRVDLVACAAEGEQGEPTSGVGDDTGSA